MFTGAEFILTDKKGNDYEKTDDCKSSGGGHAAVELPDHPHLHEDPPGCGGLHAAHRVPALQSGQGRHEYGRYPAAVQARGHRPAEGPAGGPFPERRSGPQAEPRLPAVLSGSVGNLRYLRSGSDGYYLILLSSQQKGDCPETGSPLFSAQSFPLSFQLCLWYDNTNKTGGARHGADYFSLRSERLLCLRGTAFPP